MNLFVFFVVFPKSNVKKCEICVSLISDLSDDYEIRLFVQSILAMVNKLSSIMTTVQKHRQMTLPHYNNSLIYNIGFKRDKTQKFSAKNVAFEHIFNRANILIISMIKRSGLEFFSNLYLNSKNHKIVSFSMNLLLSIMFRT